VLATDTRCVHPYIRRGRLNAMAAVIDRFDRRYQPRYHPLESTVVGVLVHNEEPTIETCLQAILAEKDGRTRVGSVLVIASGCTDKTEEIVRSVAATDRRLKLVVESERSGKASALNMLLRHSSEPFVVILGGDVVFTPGSLARLVEPLADPAVGMTGARPAPTNPRSGIVGHAVNILWDVHHELSLRRPKLGEAIAFRRVLRSIDETTLVDEASLEQVIDGLGLQLRYVPSAIVRNHGPETMGEFIAQRARIYRGHVSVATATGYRVSSMGLASPLAAGWRLWRRGGTPARYILTTMALEASARVAARLERFTRRGHENGMWHPILTSKRVVMHGHVLRAHHEAIQRLQLVPPEPDPQAHNLRALVPHLRKVVRLEDRIAVARPGLTVTIRGDALGALTLADRLLSEAPGFVSEVHMAGETNNPD
jgi:biofilm PGA synthesis N-glycosyltransferase PgaC